MEPLAALIDGFELDDLGDGRYRGHNVGAAAGSQGVVFGGLLLGQSILVAARSQPGKEVKTVHTIFARAGRGDQPLDVTLDTLHAGRGFGSVTVTVSQGERLCTRSLLLLHAPEPDVIHHGVPMPDVPGPDETPWRELELAGYQVGVVGGVDVADADAVGPAELPVWVRFDGAPDDLAVSQALLSYASDGFLIGTAMRPHKGVGQSQAHRTLSTGDSTPAPIDTNMCSIISGHETQCQGVLPLSGASRPVWVLPAGSVKVPGDGRLADAAGVDHHDASHVVHHRPGQR